MKIILRIFLFLSCFFIGLFVGFFITNRSSSFSQIVSPVAQILQIDTPLEVVGFSPYWLLAKQKENYEDLLTTWTYFSLTINPDGTIQKRVNQQEEEPGWTTLKSNRVAQMLKEYEKKNISRSLTLHLSSETDIFEMLRDATASANQLLADVLPIAKQYGFTDINVDIESFSDASASARISYTEFLTNIKKGTAHDGLTLTVEITPTSLIRSHLVNPSDIGRIADRVVLMAYDYSYSGSFISGAVAPIAGAGLDRVQDGAFSIRLALKYIPKEKLLLGIPLYGYEWDTLSKIPGSPVIPGTGKTASWSRVSQLLADGCQLCEKGRDIGAGDIPYIIIPEDGYFRQIFYEDARSIEKKMSLAREYNLAGIALWALGYEGEKLSSVMK